jgi:hypothetical protein
MRILFLSNGMYNHQPYDLMILYIYNLFGWEDPIKSRFLFLLSIFPLRTHWLTSLLKHTLIVFLRIVVIVHGMQSLCWKVRKCYLGHCSRWWKLWSDGSETREVERELPLRHDVFSSLSVAESKLAERPTQKGCSLLWYHNRIHIIV